MSQTSKISKEELKWQIEDDIRALERYSELLSDPERLKKAREYLQEKNKKINKVLKMK